MFDHLLKRLEDLNGKVVTIPIQADAKGYLDKECPDEKCQFAFKVKAEDWKNIFKDEAVYCPKCRHQAPANRWNTKQQTEMSNQQIKEFIDGHITDAMKEDARDFNRSQRRKTYIKMSMKVSGPKLIEDFFPVPAKEQMQQQIQCEKCQSSYAIIGCAFFCPCCGHNSIERTFEESIKKVGIKIDNLSFVRQAFKQAGRVDEGEITCLSLLETSLSDLVVAFQRYCEETYKSFTRSTTVPFNAFQRLDTGSDLWRTATGEGYEDWISPVALKELTILFQKRHLLAHREGMIDDKYILKSGDHSYQIGQRIVLQEAEIKRLISFLEKIVSGIKTKI